MGGKEICFLLDAGNQVCGGEGRRLSKGQLPTPQPDNQGARAVIDKGRGLHAETAQSALTVISKLVMDGLTRVILIVSSSINLLFHGWLVFISLRTILGIVATYIMATV